MSYRIENQITSKADNPIVFVGMRASRTYIKLAKHHVEKWISRQRTILFLPWQMSYSVHVIKESGNYYTCHLEVRVAFRQWSGVGEGRSVQDALQNALRSIKSTERTELYPAPVLPTAVQSTA